MSKSIFNLFILMAIISILTINKANGQSVRTEQQIKLENWNDNSKYVLLSAPNTLDSVVEFKLPINTGVAGQVLSVNESGQLVWVAPSNLSYSVPVGAVIQFAGSTAPSGWLLCDGDTILRSEYPNLYNVINTTYGSTNTTDFILPDLRQRFPLGKKGASTPLGELGGQEYVTLDTTQVPSHNHLFRIRNNSNTGVVFLTAETALGDGALISGFSMIYYPNNVSSILTAIASNAITSTGGGQAHNNMPPYLVINYIIKY